MARETTKWPSTRWPITKIMSSDGCKGNRIPLEIGPWYHFHEFGCHLGNVGLNAMVKSSITERVKRRIQATLVKSVSGAKLYLPTGETIDDVLNYIHAWFRLGYAPHVRSPLSFNDYIQSSKKRFYGDVDLARRVTDKFLFKEWLREKGCENLVVPTLAVYDDVNEVRNHVFDRHTILKPTHLSGAVIPFYESRKLTVKEISKLEKWMDTDYYRKSREKTYKGVRKRLICELLLLDSTNNIPMDYKFFMCMGRPLMIQVDIDRFANHTRQLYSDYWKLLDFGLKFPRNSVPIDRPDTLVAALDIAATLAEDFPLCRVDLYLLPDAVIKAGEITFFPEGGGGEFSPVSADFEIGHKIKNMLRSFGELKA